MAVGLERHQSARIGHPGQAVQPPGDDIGQVLDAADPDNSAKNRRVEFLIRRRTELGKAGWLDGPIPDEAAPVMMGETPKPPAQPDAPKPQ